MERIDVYFGLGSNLGNRRENLLEAVSLLDKALGRHKALSALFETEAQGFDGPPFLNACVRYRIPRMASPVAHGLELLRLVKGVEKTLGREEVPLFDADGRRIYQSRPIDIDILFYGTQTIQTQTLTVPHPRISQREFVLLPLREVAKRDLIKAFPELFV